MDENLNVSDFNRSVRNAYLQTAAEAIALAKEIGAPLINMHFAKGIYLTLPGRKVYLFEEYPKHILDCLGEFRSLCQRAIGKDRILMSIENTSGFTPFEQKAIEFLLKSPCFGLTLDIGHSHAAGNVDLPFFSAHANRLLHMHLHDAKGKNNHLAFGDGEMDLPHFIAVGQNAGARGVLETKTGEALRRSTAWLAELSPCKEKPKRIQ